MLIHNYPKQIKYVPKSWHPSRLARRTKVLWQAGKVGRLLASVISLKFSTQANLRCPKHNPLPLRALALPAKA